MIVIENMTLEARHLNKIFRMFPNTPGLLRDCVIVGDEEVWLRKTNRFSFYGCIFLNQAEA